MTLPGPIVQICAGERITVNQALIAAYRAASSSHSIRPLKSEIEAFDTLCRRTRWNALLASAETMADYLDARAGRRRHPVTRRRSPDPSAARRQGSDADPAGHTATAGGAP